MVDLINGSFAVSPIGVIHSEHVKAESTPIQPCYAIGCKGEVEIFPEYAEGLKDVEGFSHLFLIYSFHQAGSALLTVAPFLDDEPRGVFATRHPQRPNHLGLSLVRLERREGNQLIVKDIDILDGTPLLDIKPFRPQFDVVTNAKAGWMEKIDPQQARVCGRRGYRGQGRSNKKGLVDVYASAEKRKEFKMKIALPSAKDMVDGHFGHCESFTVFTIDENKRVVNQERIMPPPGCGCKSDIVTQLSELGVTVMLAGNMGQGAVNVLQAHGISVVRGCRGPLQAVVEAWLAGRIADSGMGCSEHGHDHGDQGCPGHE